jgi:archaellin
MAICVPSLTQRTRLQLTSFISLEKGSSLQMEQTTSALTSTSSILRQYGVLIATPSMHVTYAFTLTIGRTSGESLINMTMKRSSVLNGRPSTSFKHTQTAARMSTSAAFPMAGKSKSTILITIRCMHAGKERLVKRLTVLTITMKGTKGILLGSSTSSSRRTELDPQEATKHSTITINPCS